MGPKDLPLRERFQCHRVWPASPIHPFIPGKPALLVTELSEVI